MNENLPKVKFPPERHPNNDISLLRIAVRSIFPVGGIVDKLGKLKHNGYKVCDWRYDLENERLLYLLGDKIYIYTPSTLAGTQRPANRWIRSRAGKPANKCGKAEILQDCLMEVL